MAPKSGCVVGVDGLPLGTSAAVAVDGAIVDEVELVTPGGRPIDLDGRIDEAMHRAASGTSRRVDQVRLVFLDDGSTGDWLAGLESRLASSDVQLVVIDLTNGGASVGQPSSAARARLAALGPDTDGADHR
jgi:hypothetical protein